MHRRIAQRIRDAIEDAEWLAALQIEVVLPETLVAHLTVSLEGQGWHPSRLSDYWIRMDPARPEHNHQRHVHIAHQRHIKGAKGQQVAWNQDGSRHDQMHFNTALGKRKDVQRLAREALDLPSHVSLADITAAERLMSDFDVHERAHVDYLLTWNGSSAL